MKPVSPRYPALLDGFAFGSGGFTRPDALREDPDGLAALWPRARVMLLDADGQALADASGALMMTTGAALGGGPGNALLVGLLAGEAWFCMEADAVPVAAPGRVDLRRAAATWPAAHAGAFAFARAMQHWRARNRHCGRCGAPNHFRRAGYMAHCTQCEAEQYPRVDPAVIVAVTDGERLLLGRQSSWPARRYSLVAGFVEPGETLEQTVAREVLEETCVRVRSCRYLGAQPWPFPGALMLGFIAEAESDVPKVDGELEDARWFSVDEIAAARAREAGPEAAQGEGILLSPRISIARSLIEYWYASMIGAPTDD